MIQSKEPATSSFGAELPIQHVHLSVGYQGKADSKCWLLAMSHMRDRRRELLFRKMKSAARTYKGRRARCVRL
jgi:hypothetical protein